MFGFTIGLSIWLLRFDPELLVERMTGVGRADQEAWDKILLAITAVVFFGWLVVMALDAGRFRWSRVPPSLRALSASCWAPLSTSSFSRSAKTRFSRPPFGSRRTGRARS